MNGLPGYIGYYMQYTSTSKNKTSFVHGRIRIQVLIVNEHTHYNHSATDAFKRTIRRFVLKLQRHYVKYSYCHEHNNIL